MALIYGILYLFFEAYPIAFQEQRGWNEGEDPFVWIQPRNLPAHIAALQRHLPR